MEEKNKGKSVLVEDCSRCEELEPKCVELEAEIEKSRSGCEILEAKFKGIEAEMSEVEAAGNANENELDALKDAGDGVDGGGDPPRCPEDGWQIGPNIVGHVDWGEGHDGDGNVEREEGHNGDEIVEQGEGEGHDLPSFVELEKDEEREVDTEIVDVVQLMVDNTFLECLKRKTEDQAEFLEHKLRRKNTRVVPRLRNEDAVEIGGGSGGQPLAEAPTNDSASQHVRGDEDGLNVESKVENEASDNSVASKHTKGEEKGSDVESKVEYCEQVRKHLTAEDQSPSKRMAPLTPRVASSVILIVDSDDESEVDYVQVSEGTMDDKHEMISEGGLERAVPQQSDEENMVDYMDSILFASTSKRKRASNVVTSDTERDFEDDYEPICEVEKMHFVEIIPDQDFPEMNWSSIPAGDDNTSNLASPQKRRLVPLRKLAEKTEAGKRSSSNTSETKCQRGIPTTEDVEDDVSEKTESESEGESLNGFIVESTEESDNVDGSSDAPVEPDDDEDFNGILSGLRRSKGKKIEWEFEGDMLAAFGKDPELCMKAVCAVYRQQTNEEKVSKGSLVHNSRGFSKIDAHRGTTLAEFLTDGDPQGDLKKSVKELQEYDPKAIETCRTLATRYSKQLFEIYKNKEDALFLPA